MLYSAFLLHSRPYRETSLLIELFTKDAGRVSLVARGAKKKQSTLQPFYPLLVSWVGRGPLFTLQSVELDFSNFIAAKPLIGKNLVCAMYINELLFKSLATMDPHPNLYNKYQELQNRLRETQDLQIYLRLFEKTWLTEIGYGLQLDRDHLGNPICENRFYHYDPLKGPVVSCVNNGISGESLLAFGREILTTKFQLQEIKNMMRQLVSFHLGGNLKSRELVWR